MKIPADAVMTGHLLVVEYLEPDGTFSLKFETCGTGNETLPLGKTLHLIEYARIQATAEMMADIVSEHFEYDEVDVGLGSRDDEDDYEDEDEDEDAE